MLAVPHLKLVVLLYSVMFCLLLPLLNCDAAGADSTGGVECLLALLLLWARTFAQPRQTAN